MLNLKVLDKKNLCAQYQRRLYCIRLRSYRTEGDISFLFTTEYSLIPIETVKGNAHIIRDDLALNVLTVHSKLKRSSSA